VKVVFKELPIFGDDSEDAAKGAIAAAEQGKYLEMHQALFSKPGRANKDKVLSIAEEIGLDVSQLETDMKSDAVQAALDEVRDLADKLDIRGTPIFLVNDGVIPGAPKNLYDHLLEKVAEARGQE
jgi:protein-disulfide isomerase